MYIISNKYLRMLAWGIGAAVFGLFLTFIYSFLSKKIKRTVIRINGYKKEIMSIPEWILFLGMTFLAGIRLNVGSDYYYYYTHFNAVNRSTRITFSDITSQSGFYLLSYLTKKITDYEYAIFWVIAIIIYGMLFYIIKNEVQDRPTAFFCYVFLGFYANSFNILKQSIAMMFVVLFSLSLREGNKTKSVAYAMLAVLFHYSTVFALVILLIITIIKVKPSIKLFYAAVFIGAFVAIFLPQILAIIIRFIPSASGYEVYINWRRNNQIRFVLGVAGVSIMFYFLVFNVVKSANNIRELSEKRYYEITFLIIGLAINIASIRIWLFHRIALYFYQFIILVLPAYFQCVEVKEREKIKRIYFLIMFFYLIFIGIFLGENGYYTFNTVFSGDSPIYDTDFNRMINGY